MKKLIAVMLALFMLMPVLAGCGNKVEETVSSENEKTVVTMTSAYELSQFESAFEAAHPEVDLQIEKLATATINGEVARRLRNEHGSDIIITNLPEGEIAGYTYDLSAESFVEQYQASIIRSVAN